jgi:hypothetical protein
MNDVATGRIARKPSPRWAYVCSYLLILVSFCSHVFALDRYPMPYVDEAFFYYPAIRALEGHGLNYRTHSQEPYGDIVFSLHAPFFPRTQAAAFFLLGISQFACRFTPYLAAHLAILLLCQFLLRVGLFRSAVVVAVAWLGDRSNWHILYGRPEGVCMFFEVAGFVALVRAITKPSLWAAFLTGLLLGIGVGFHPVTAPLPLCACILLPLLVRQHKLKALLSLAAGGLASICLIFLSLSPYPVESVQQFLWGQRYGGDVHTSLTRPQQWVDLIEALGQSKYWFLGLCLVTLLLLVPLILVARSRAKSLGDVTRETVFIVAAAFAVFMLLVGLVLLAGVAIQPYYLVYFTVWPVVALAVYVEGNWLSGWPRLVLYAACAALFTCWLPSLRFNVQRFRELVACYHDLDPNPVARQLAGAIPEGALVTGGPEFTLFARKAGIHFTPLPWYPEAVSIAPDAYVLLIEPDLHAPWHRVDADNLNSRPVVLEGNMAPGTGMRWSRFVLFGPTKSRN